MIDSIECSPNTYILLLFAVMFKDDFKIFFHKILIYNFWFLFFHFKLVHEIFIIFLKFFFFFFNLLFLIFFNFALF